MDQKMYRDAFIIEASHMQKDPMLVWSKDVERLSAGSNAASFSILLDQIILEDLFNKLKYF